MNLQESIKKILKEETSLQGKLNQLIKAQNGGKSGKNAKILGDIFHGKIGVSPIYCFEKSNLGVPC